MKLEIISAMEKQSGAMTANAIAKALGYAKSTTKTNSAIGGMVASGDVVVSKNDRGYDVYSLAGGRSVAGVTTANPSEEEADEYATVDVAVEEAVSWSIPENTHSYGIQNSDNADFTFHIDFPDGKSVDLSQRERLLVINNDTNYRFVVDSPEDVLQCIGVYTQEKGYAHFLVTDMASGKHVRNPEEMSTDVILFLEIHRHNKAGK